MCAVTDLRTVAIRGADGLFIVGVESVHHILCEGKETVNRVKMAV